VPADVEVAMEKTVDELTARPLVQVALIPETELRVMMTRCPETRL